MVDVTDPHSSVRQCSGWIGKVRPGLVATGAVAFLVSCAPAFRTPVIGALATVRSYRLGQAQAAGIGDPVFDVQMGRAVPTFRVTRDHDVEGEQLPTLRLRAGTRFIALRRDESSGQLLLASPEFSEEWWLVAHPDGAMAPALYYVPRGERGMYEADFSWPPDLLERVEDSLRPEEGAFRAQMLYSGMDGSTIRTTYREFSGNFIRPAFSQDLQYDIGQDSVIAYRSIQIRVITASNQRLEYMVVEDADLPWLPGRAP